MQNFDIFLIFPRNIDNGYMLEPSLWYPLIYALGQKKKEKQEYPCEPQVYFIKVRYEGVLTHI